MRILVCVLAGAITAVFESAQPTFSSRVEGVRVDVLVTDSSRKPLRGLTPADFVIRDNGIPQQVDVVSFGEIALNVGLAFDMSESVAGARLRQLQSASKALTTELQAVDQSSLITFDHEVSLRCPMSRDRSCVERALADVEPRGLTALIDGTFAGMLTGESDVGRSLLMVFSDGFDTASFLNVDRVLEIGRRSDVVVYPIASRDARPDFLEELASLTGGQLHEVGRDEELSKTFRAILDEFRHRYLLTYTPTNVAKGGWHKLDVRVNRPGARVKARPGYQGE
ncbi:MAG TPA: VWA domain-containing protein [Vicinamibacterales bacterium]